MRYKKKRFFKKEKKKYIYIYLVSILIYIYNKNMHRKLVIYTFLQYSVFNLLHYLNFRIYKIIYK